MTDYNNADGSYSYANHAKHWGELKGFALGLQFNPWSLCMMSLSLLLQHDDSRHEYNVENDCGAGSRTHLLQSICSLP